MNILERFRRPTKPQAPEGQHAFSTTIVPFNHNVPAIAPAPDWMIRGTPQPQPVPPAPRMWDHSLPIMVFPSRSIVSQPQNITVTA